MTIQQPHTSLPLPPYLDQSISIIIPVLNEAGHLAQTLAAIQTVPNVEIIVVDGGSQDHTASLAKELGATVIVTKPGRANQMNIGAIAAEGDILLFLHGDTHLPTNFDQLIRTALAKPNVVAGAFTLKINQSLPGLRLVEWGVNLRSRVLHMPYGDQAIFLSSNVFHQVGGFPDLPIMEDFELMRRLRRLGRIAIVPAAILTSGRRWKRLGVVKTTRINQIIIIAYLLGVSPTQLKRWYSNHLKR